MDFLTVGRRSASYLASVVLCSLGFVSTAFSQTSTCELMPIAIEESVLSPLSTGDTASQISIKKQHGNFGWLTWAGSPSAPVLANSLTLPGDSDTYVNPNNASDTVLDVGDWAQGSPGVTGAKAVKNALNALLNVPITVPVWDQHQGSGNNLDYHVVSFARIALTEYRLNGNGWLTFTYLGGVNCSNTPPVAQNLSASLDEDSSVGVTLLASDVDEDALTYTVVSMPANGQLSGDAPALTYTPAANYHGTDSFTYIAHDGNADSNIATVTLTVNPLNDAPVAFNQQLEFAEDTVVPITLGWEDIDGDSVTLAVLTQPLNGTLSGAGENYTYTPDANFVGDDSFTFQANDGALDSNVATVFLTTNPVNDAPVADNGSTSTLEDEPVAITLHSSDVDGDVLTYTVLAAPAHGTVSFTSTNTVTYQPALGYFGPDQFTFFTSDGQLDSNVATITIEVTEKNKPPQIVSDAVETATQRAPYVYDTEATDPNTGDILTFSLLKSPEGMAIDASTGEISWSPAEAYVSGLDSVNSYCALTTYDEQYRAMDLVFLTDTTGGVTLSATLLNDLSAQADLALRDLDIGVSGNPNQYGLVSISDSAAVITVSGESLYPAADVPDGTAQLSAAAAGPTDGLAALALVVDNYPLRAPVAKHLVLGIDEAPTAIDQATLDTLTTQLQAEDYALSVIVDAAFRCADGTLALGVDANNVGYFDDNGSLGVCQNPV